MFSAGRVERIVEQLLGGDPHQEKLRRVCDVCTDVIGVDGSALILVGGDLAPRVVGDMNPVSGRLAKLETTLCEGPSADAHRLGEPQLEPYLDDDGQRRWPAFAAAGLDLGVAAVFAFPLRLGGLRLGTLNLHRDHAGPLEDSEVGEAVATSAVVSRAILLLEADAPDERLGVEMHAADDLRSVVNQACGMAAVQLDTSVLRGALRLRIHAFSTSARLVDVAHDVVARRLRFDAVTPLGDHSERVTAGSA
jgi:hypothetical protein